MKQLHRKSGRERWVAYSHCLCKLTLCLEAGLSQEDFPWSDCCMCCYYYYLAGLHCFPNMKNMRTHAWETYLFATSDNRYFINNYVTHPPQSTTPFCIHIWYDSFCHTTQETIKNKFFTVELQFSTVCLIFTQGSDLYETSHSIIQQTDWESLVTVKWVT